MRCPANSHKTSFHVNTSITKTNFGKGSSSSHSGGAAAAAAASNMEENMSEEEFFEWLQNAMQSGMFENFNGVNPNEPSTKNDTKTGNANTSGGGGGGGSTSSSRRKKKGKKQW